MHKITFIFVDKMIIDTIIILFMVKLMVGGLKMPRHGENIWKRKDGRWEGRYKLPTGTYHNKTRTKYRLVYGRTYTDVKPYCTSTSTCNPACFQAIRLNVSAFQVVDFIEMPSRVIRYSKDVNEWLVITVPVSSPR